MSKNIIKFLKAEEGATLAEYGILIALIAVVAIATIGELGTTINAKFGEIMTSLGG